MMEAKSTKKKAKRKLTVEERRALYNSIPPGNKYMKAAREHQGSFIVYDPAFM